MRLITTYDLDELLQQAKSHPRKRTILRLHEHAEPVQRMVNALVPGTYVPPHKHEDPDKVELFCILRGKLAVLDFDDIGTVTDVHILSSTGEARVVDIPPRRYHSIIALEPSAALEIIQGPYDPATHKRLAPWALSEDNPKAHDYLLYLESIVENWR